MSCVQQQRRSTGLRIAERLNKYITLPNRHSFTVDSKDVFQRGQVLSYIRSKAPFLLEHISEAKERLITVTSRGLMIIYENDDHGLVIDLRSARNVLCTADRSKKQRHFRCHIKIRMQRGNVHLFVGHNDVHKWTCAIMRAAGKCLPSTEPRDDGSLNVAMMTAVEDSGIFEEMSSTSSASYDYDEDDEVDEVKPTAIEQIPLPHVSVRSLRQKLEKELVLKPKEQVLAEQQHKANCDEPSFVSEIFCTPRAVFSDETVVLLEPTNARERREYEAQADRENQWWTRSLRC
ncbi:DUF7778 domain-containing protein [Caenorhabditis elegans]|uniref:PH domain-containing protein n=1 Tax=Caenorhabditis elegans TaxID=6239 RepID=Q9XVT3_CAEEL|nr:PH domain-containing protein [Caenorhabditis elegans]CAB02728.1 PH domain-containing protein [Caenorhabditis elegans]|eukprot:NP_493080.1 Uncharacterized protein CELE_C15C6.2 [Caenorhabditis elegans]